jgi:hypothetical protein
MDARSVFLQSQRLSSLMQIEANTSLINAIHADTPCNRFDFLLDDLNRNNIDQESIMAYEISVHWLSVLYDNSNLDYVFKFTAKARPRFIELLIQNDPRTLTIVGYFFVLLKTLDQAVWVPKPTEKEFGYLMKLLPDEWKPRMEWAVNVFQGAAAM